MARTPRQKPADKGEVRETLDRLDALIAEINEATRHVLRRGDLEQRIELVTALENLEELTERMAGIIGVAIRPSMTVADVEKIIHDIQPGG